MQSLLAVVLLVVLIVGAISVHRHEREDERARAREWWGDHGDDGL